MNQSPGPRLFDRVSHSVGLIDAVFPKDKSGDLVLARGASEVFRERLVTLRILMRHSAAPGADVAGLNEKLHASKRGRKSLSHGYQRGAFTPRPLPSAYLIDVFKAMPSDVLREIRVPGWAFEKFTSSRPRISPN